MRARASGFLLIFVFPSLFLLYGCATARHPVPPELITEARIMDMEEIRVMTGESNTKLQESLIESVKNEAPGDYAVDNSGVKTYPVLAISGGGANGAYGAGFIKGWSKEGTRPKFKVVTGVSTGAIMAVFAFLGQDYDDELEKYYTTMSTKDVVTSKWPLAPIFGNSFMSNAPLYGKIKDIVTEEHLKKIAEEHKRGRRLFVGTADLDAERFVVWDMGAIACRNDEKLFCDVILASAAIPMIFPPSIFRVTAGGKTYDEMHVDGGTITQVFSVNKLVEGMQGAAHVLRIDPSKIRSKLYIIRNGYMSPQYKKIDDKMASIAAKSFDTMIDAQGVGDTYRIYAFVNKRGDDYNLAYIPADFKMDNKEMFDKKTMRRLFDRGYDDALNGYKWHKAPPGMDGQQAGVNNR
jgi:predicted patatin/cPLA2 family phospholipase